MSEDPLDAVYAYVERAYVRLQAGDLLVRCIEDGSLSPMQQIVEGFVLAGPQSMDSLREILSEAAQRKSQVLDDLNQLLVQLEENLKSYGIQMGEVKSVGAILTLAPVRFLTMLRDQGMEEEDTQIICLQLLRDSKELMLTMVEHLHVLADIETYLQDWLWGLAFQSVHQKRDGTRPSNVSEL